MKQESAEREAEVHVALKRFYNRTHWEPATHETPLTELLRAEDGAIDEWAVRCETVRCILGWIGAEGPDPATALKRLYAIGDHMMVEPFCLLTLREKGKMLGDSHGAQLWRRQRLCVDLLRRKGARNYKAPGQKGLHAAAAAARAQAGNHNRAEGKKAAKQTTKKDYAKKNK